MALLVHCLEIKLEFEMMFFFVEGKKQDGPRKNHRSKDENPQQNQLTCDARSGSRILVTIFERVGIFI